MYSELALRLTEAWLRECSSIYGSAFGTAQQKPTKSIQEISEAYTKFFNVIREADQKPKKK